MSPSVLESPNQESAIAPEPSKPGGIARRRKTLLISGGAAAFVLLLVFGVRYLVWSAHHESTDDAYLEGHVHPISARITDTVQQVLIDDNQHVVEGQTLVILDPNDYKVRPDEAKAALDAAARQADTAEAAIQLDIAVRDGADDTSCGHHRRGKSFDPGVEGRRHCC